MKVPSLILGVALAFPMAMMAQSMPANSNYNNNNQSHMSNMSNQQFLNKLAQEDQSEINLAHLALQKSNNAQVRQYAQSKILKADPSMEQHAKTTAQNMGTPVNASVNNWGQHEYQKLSQLSGQQFDREYMRYESMKQEKDLNLVQHEANNSNNTQVKDFAQAQVVPVREAAQSARQISSGMGNSPQWANHSGNNTSANSHAWNNVNNGNGTNTQASVK